MKDFNQIQEIILGQNPWWRGDSVPNELAPPIERPLAKKLWSRALSSELRRYLLILGPRRVGKTTVMYQTVKRFLEKAIPPEKIQWIRLDHPKLMSYDLGTLAKDAIKRAKADKKNPLYLFLDELVYAANWEKWLKTFYDERWPLRIVASSSASAALQKGKESGAGRWLEIYLSPYSLKELLDLNRRNIQWPEAEKSLSETIESLAHQLPYASLNFKKEREDLMLLGGFPELLTAGRIIDEQFEKDRQKFKIIKDAIETEQWDKIMSLYKKTERSPEGADDDYYMGLADLELGQIDFKKRQEQKDRLYDKARVLLRSDAVERVIYKDIPQSYGVDSPIALERLLYVLAGQAGSLLSLSQIGKDISMSALTIERYLNYLRQSYLVFALPNYAGGERHKQRRQRKSYFFDIAVRNAALLKGRDEIAHDRTERGRLQENLVAAHLQNLSKQSRIRLYHWRRGKYEADFVYDDPAQPLVFEIGSSLKHPLRGLKKFLEENPKFKKGAYYSAPDLPFVSSKESPSGIGHIPLDLLLLSAGLLQEKALSLFLKD